MSATHFPIAIIGAGLGGLTLARVLHQSGIESAVFDLEPSDEARGQGGMLDIHEESGQEALRAAGLHAQFLTKVHPGGQATRVLDKNCRVLREEADDGTGGRPEIDRGDLRELLRGSLPEGTIRWGAKATSVTRVGDSVDADAVHEVTFADGTSITADLLVGADGAWSRVRPLLSDAMPAYTGVSFVELDLFDAETRHPESAQVIGGGFFFALGENRAMLAHRETDGSLHVYVSLRIDEPWIGTIDFTDAPAAKAVLLDEFEGWAPQLRRLIEDADVPMIPRRIHALPIGHAWPRTPGVTLLGDAAHVMSPFAGEGANLAMLDAAELGLAVAAHPGDVEKALAAYESALFPRVERSATESAQGLDTIMNDEGPGPLIRLFESYEEAVH